MPCPSSVIQGGPILLYTDKANSLTHPLTGVLESNAIVVIRPAGEILLKTSGLSGLTIQCRYSDDGITWGSWFTATNTPTWTTDGPKYGAAWLDIVTGQTVKRYLQIGAKVDGTGGTTTNEICGFAWRIETRGA